MEDLYIIGIVGFCAMLYTLCRVFGPLKHTVGDDFSVSSTTTRGVAIVTGSNTGIGFETALALAKKNYDVILACRNESKGRRAVRKINEQTISRRARFMKLDLSSSSSIVNFVKSLDEAPGILVNNAGLNTFGETRYTEDGLEIHFGVNYFGHFFLTTLIIDRFFENEERHLRVVNLSSVTHWKGHCDFRTLSRTYRKDSYSSSKLAMNLFTLELRRRHKNVCAVAVNPGAVFTDIYRDMQSECLLKIIRSTFLSSKLGSRTSVFAASASVGDLCGNIYLTPYFVPRFLPECLRACFDIGGPFYAGVHGTAPSYNSRSRILGNELWEYSEVLAAEFL